MDKLLHERLRESKKGQSWLTVRPYDDDFIIKRSDAERLADEIERYYIPRPRFEDGEPVQFGSNEPEWVDTDNYSPQTPWRVTAISQEGIPMATAGSTIVARAAMTDGRLVKRSTPKVLDADGVEIKVGDTVWASRFNCSFTVDRISKNRKGETLVMVEEMGSGLNPDYCYHEKPVFDAEGVRICKGDTVWTINVPKGHTKCTVSGFKTLDEIGVDDGDKPSTHAVFFEEGGWMGNLRVTHREPDSYRKVADYLESIIEDLEDRNFNKEWIDELKEANNRLAALIERESNG